MRRMSIITFVILVAFGLGYFLLKPNYTISYYKFKNCSKTVLTKIEYSRFGERGVVFAYGHLKEKPLPEKESLVGVFLGGWDSNYEVVATCSGEKISINYISGYYTSTFPLTKISPNRVNTDTFFKLKDTPGNIYIEGY